MELSCIYHVDAAPRLDQANLHTYYLHFCVCVCVVRAPKMCALRNFRNAHVPLITAATLCRRSLELILPGHVELCIPWLPSLRPQTPKSSSDSHHSIAPLASAFQNSLISETTKHCSSYVPLVTLLE